MKHNVIIFALLVLFLAGCAAPKADQSKELTGDNSIKFEDAQVKKSNPKPIDTRRVEVSPPPQSMRFPVVKTFSCIDVSLGHAVQLLVQPYGYALDADDTIDLSRNVSFVRITDLPLNQAVFRLLANTGYGYEADPDRKVIRILSRVTRTWRVPIINLVERASVDLQAGGEQIEESSSAYSRNQSNTSSKDKAKGIRFQSTSVVKDPWADIEKYLKSFLTKDGRMLIDRVTGIVTVTDKPRVIHAVDEYLAKVIDVASRQVSLSVTVMEVTITDTFKMGVDWSKMASVVGGNWRTSFNFLGQPSESASLTTASGAGQLLIGNGDVEAIIGALSTFGKVKVVASPSVRVMNNSTAQMFVGHKTPFLSRYQNISSGQSYDQTVETGTVSTGVAISVTPNISDNGTIQLSVVPSLSELVKIVEFNPVENAKVSRPETTSREMRTQVSLHSGETVVMGGLIYNKDNDSDKGLPGAKDIPWLGNLFKYQEKTSEKTELVISIRPVLVNPGQEITS